MRHRTHTGEVRHHCQRCVLEALSMFMYPHTPTHSNFLLEFSDLVAHPNYSLQIIPCFATSTLIGKFSMYMCEDLAMVIVQTNHGYSFRVEVIIKDGGHCYFEKDLWRDFDARYVLEFGTKVLVDISQPGLIIHVVFPAQICRWTNKESKGQFFWRLLPEAALPPASLRSRPKKLGRLPECPVLGHFGSLPNFLRRLLR